MPLLIRTYLLFTFIFSVLSYLIIYLRLWSGKEDQDRFKEKLGRYEWDRSNSKLIWFHGASVGETLSIIGLIKEITKINDKLEFLITSGTKTSSQVLSMRMPKNAVHQFVPIDTPGAVKLFLKHWRPDFAIWIESEVWPRLLIETSKTKIPMWLVNGSMSLRSYKKWRYAPLSMQYLYNKFEKIYLRDERSAGFLNQLGLSSENFNVYGSLKADQEKLEFRKSDLKELKKGLKEKRVWVASSTHPGEEEIVLKAHKDLLKVDKNIFLVLVPRHPERGKELMKLALSLDLKGSLRSKSKKINSTDQVHIADTLGELGLWYELTHVSFIGGSITRNGGHNPYEAILADTFIIHGPETFNFEEIYQKLDERNFGKKIINSEQLFQEVLNLFNKDKVAICFTKAKELIASDKKKIKTLANQIYDRLQEP